MLLYKKYILFILTFIIFIYAFTTNITNYKVFAETATFSKETDEQKEEKVNKTYNKNVPLAYKVIQNNLDAISNGLKGVATAFSVVVIALIGFKIIKCGQGDITNLIKEKQDLKNAIASILFLTLIPFLVTSIKNFKMPQELWISIDNTYSAETTIDNLNTTIKNNFIIDFYQNKLKKLESYSYEENLKEEDKEDFINNNKDLISGASADGLSTNITSALRNIFVDLIYNPTRQLTYYTTSLSYLPISFNNNFYESDTYDNVIYKTTKSDVAKESTAYARAGWLKANKAVTLIFNFLYKISFMFLECICYYNGLMFLFNKNALIDIKMFLKKLLISLAGLLLFPSFLDFLLSLDTILSTALVSISGNLSPGTTILEFIPGVSLAEKSWLYFILGIAIMVILILFSLIFLQRRAVIVLLYIAAPILFVGYLIKKDTYGFKNIVNMLLFNIFLNTLLSPVLFIIGILIRLIGTDLMLSIINLFIIISLLLYIKKVAKKNITTP